MHSFVIVSIVSTVVMYLIFLSTCLLLRHYAKRSGLPPSLMKSMIRKSNLGIALGTAIVILGIFVQIFHIFLWVIWVGVSAALIIFAWLSVVNYRKIKRSAA